MGSNASANTRKGKPLLVHVSGPPGSGKTWLGDKIKQTYGSLIHVLDTDLFIKHGSESAQRLRVLEDAYNSAVAGAAAGTGTADAVAVADAAYLREWHMILDNAFQNAVDFCPVRALVIVFVGSLDHFGGGEFHTPTLVFDHKIFLDVPLPVLLQRYYSRLATYDAEYWTHVATGEYGISGAAEVIQDSKKSVAWHDQRGYVHRNAAEVIHACKSFVEQAFISHGADAKPNA